MDPKEIEFLVKNMDCSPITPSKTRFVGTHQPVTGVENPCRIENRLYIYTQTTIIVRLCTLNIGRPTVRAVCIDAKSSRFNTRPGSGLKHTDFLKIEPVSTKIIFVKVTKKKNMLC